jgi:hypothetical protein
MEGGKLYLDIGDESWSAIEIDASGWRIVTSPPIRFLRSRGALPLPIPVKGGSIQLLHPFCNVSDAGFVLLVGVLLAGLRAGRNFPVLVLSGEQGCGKSSQARCVVGLTDPHIPEQRSMPRSEEDLLVAAKGAHVLSFDNVSGLSDWLSDAICRLSTGGGAGKRKLYSDEDEILFSGRRLVVLNGIEDVQFALTLLTGPSYWHLSPFPRENAALRRNSTRTSSLLRPRSLAHCSTAWCTACAISRPSRLLASRAWPILRCGRKLAREHTGPPAHSCARIRKTSAKRSS